MNLRAATTLLTIAVVAAACTSGSDAGSGLADGDQTVEEVVAAEAPAEVETPADESRTAGEGDGEEAQVTTGGGSTDIEALWWTAETVVGGDEFVAADLAGQHVVLWMWAPWCSVCEREAPEVAEALAELPGDVTLVGVAGRDEVEAMRGFVAEHDLGGMTHVVDADGSVWASYGISYQPAWVFIDDQGNAAVAAGAIGYDGLFEGIEQVFRG